MAKGKTYTGTLQEQLQQYKDDRVKVDPDFAREVEAARWSKSEVNDGNTEG